jgi:hypothetical protein
LLNLTIAGSNEAVNLKTIGHPGRHCAGTCMQGPGGA